jgi:hypothetical protein
MLVMMITQLPLSLALAMVSVMNLLPVTGQIRVVVVPVVVVDLSQSHDRLPPFFPLVDRIDQEYSWSLRSCCSQDRTRTASSSSVVVWGVVVGDWETETMGRK